LPDSQAGRARAELPVVRVPVAYQEGRVRAGYPAVQLREACLVARPQEAYRAAQPQAACRADRLPVDRMREDCPVVQRCPDRVQEDYPAGRLREEYRTALVSAACLAAGMLAASQVAHT
jgi:hypothetical protein